MDHSPERSPDEESMFRFRPCSGMRCSVMATIYLVCGYKGSGKSTLIRWLASLCEKSRMDWLTGRFTPSKDVFVGQNYQQRNARCEQSQNIELKWHLFGESSVQNSADDIFVHLDVTNFFIRIVDTTGRPQILRMLSSADFREFREIAQQSIIQFLAELRNQSQLEVKAILLEAEWNDCFAARKDRALNSRKSALLRIAKKKMTPRTIVEIYSAIRGLLSYVTFTWRGHNRVVWGKKHGPTIHRELHETFAETFFMQGIDFTRVTRRENLPPSVLQLVH